ncbi:MAG TPA: serine/threonine-protein kinase [Candidatus Obscuribacterales bacterium]
MNLSIQESLMQHLEKNYAIEGEVGRGGMGVVFRARDKRLDRPVAIKVLHLATSGGAELQQEVVARFQREARAVARLSHPNLVMVYDVGQEGDFYYMIQEFAEGKALSDLIAGQRGLPPAVVTSIGHQICQALAAAHEMNITHRDIKPANIILSAKGVAKLTDFGIAQLNQEDSARLTQAGAVVGSILYASPEQLRDATSVDARSDLYSLGVTLYELLTGRSPYQAEQISQLILEIMTQETIPSLRQNHPEIPETLELVVQRAMKKDREERYQKATEMAGDLARLLQLAANAPQTFQINFAEGNASPTRNRATDSVLLRRTSVNPQLMDQLRQDNTWVNRLISAWKQEAMAMLPLDKVLEKVLEPNLFGKSLTGCLSVDQRWLLLICDGQFVGAADLQSESRGEAVFDALPASAASLELRVAGEDQHLVPLLIGNILEASGEVIQSRLDSSLVDLVPLIENFANADDPLNGYVVCQSESNLFYYGYDHGKQVFAAAAKPEQITGESWLTLTKLAQEEGMLVEVHRCQPEVHGPSQEKLLESAKLKLVYKDPAKTTLQKLLDAGDDELPIHLIREAKENARLELEMTQAPVLRLGDQAFDLSAQITQSIPKRLGDWLVNEYFYLLNSSGNTVSLKYIYSWIPPIQQFSFAESLKGEDGKHYRFSLVARGVIQGEGYDKVLLLMRVGKGNAAEVERFLHDVTEVKKGLIKSGDIGGAIYVSTENYDTDALKLFYEKTVETRKKGFSLGALDKLTKYKGFVRIGLNRGFHLNLLEYHSDGQGFEVIAPLLK